MPNDIDGREGVDPFMSMADIENSYIGDKGAETTFDHSDKEIMLPPIGCKSYNRCFHYFKNVTVSEITESG